MIVLGMLLGLLQVRFERILGCTLEIDVDGRVNAVAFVYRAVPSHRCDHLLTNVIHCVSLALCGLPAADGDLFGAGSCTLFTGDESIVAHPIESKVSCLT